MIIEEGKLKEILVENGHIKAGDFDMAQKEAAEKDASLQEILVKKGLIKDEQLGRMIADEKGYKFMNLKRANIEEISDKLLDLIPEVVAVNQQAIAFAGDEKKVKVATCKPDNYPFFKILEKKIDREVDIYYSTPFDMIQALKKYRGDMLTEVNDLIKKIEKSGAVGEQSIVDLVDLIMEYAHTNLASDIHIEPLTEFAIIRFRIDGILHKVAEYPKEMHNRIVSRLKILAKLRTDEKAAAQDGRFQYETSSGDVDVRVSIMPTTEGENVVMRLLMQRGRRFSIDELGLLDDDLKKMKRAAKRPYGMIMVVGPTGSGKTTTLYSVLQMLNNEEVNIMTIEDPTEYNMEGVQQTQVNPAKDITFPKGLRSIVRQDPDIIMVGEIRDEETVDMALNSAMTGHLVLSTMHANDAATAFPRFLEMGAESFLVASSINVTIAQRLVRTVCEECKKTHTLTQDEIEKIKEDEDLVEAVKRLADEDDLEDIVFYKGEGCKYCEGVGYSGRTAIFEVLEVTEEIKNMIVEKESSDIIKRKARELGMSTMVHDGVKKALMGLTTLEEVRKVARL